MVKSYRIVNLVPGVFPIIFRAYLQTFVLRVKNHLRFPLHTMKNLPQFRNKSHEEVRQYILEKKGVGIGSNINAVHAVTAVIALAAITNPLWIEKLIEWYEKRKKGDEWLIYQYCAFHPRM